MKSKAADFEWTPPTDEEVLGLSDFDPLAWRLPELDPGGLELDLSWRLPTLDLDWRLPTDEEVLGLRRRPGRKRSGKGTAHGRTV